MTIGQVAGVTDAGRKRRRNEDAYVADPPLFVVADGMGGAQAGEIASQLATGVFREPDAGGGSAPEERVAALVQEANRRIYERARRDAEASGMGTTITAALLDDGRIVIGHVGDSRAYRIRDDELEQLTQDHSLVADLIRSGRLTPEEAETHPQRSVITRVLGTDPEVDVDVLAVEAKLGDIFLLGFDGLTTMVGDDEILEAVRAHETLQLVARALVEEANRRGGEDNVTVVLFEVEDTAAEDGRADEGLNDLEDTLTRLEVPAAVRAPSASPPGAPPVEEAEATGWVPVEERRGRGERRRRSSALVLSLLGLLLVAAVLAGGLWFLSRSHFIGAHEDGHVAVYQGVPWEITSDVVLYRARYISELQAVQLSREERADLFEHELMGYDAAREELARYELEAPR